MRWMQLQTIWRLWPRAWRPPPPRPGASTSSGGWPRLSWIVQTALSWEWVAAPRRWAREWEGAARKGGAGRRNRTRNLTICPAQTPGTLCSKIREVSQALKALDARLPHSLAAGTRLSASAAAICGCSTSRRSGRCGRAHRTPSRLKITTPMSTLPAHGSWRSCCSHLRRQRAGCGCGSRLHHTQQRTAAGAAACAAQQEVPGLLPRRLTVGAGAVVPLLWRGGGAPGPP